MAENKADSGYRVIKRVLDVTLSLGAMIGLSPVLLLTAILVRAKLGSPVLFQQPRPGKDERIFYLYKFRSMTNAVDQNGRILPDNQRLTKFGKLLRASSLDELPELLNILKGDMSIVGPRPLSMYYLPHYSREQRLRHSVRPGLTGLAQISGRSNLNWDERFEKDIEYIRGLSFSEDVQIVLGTVKKVLGASDVSVRGENTVKDFGTYATLKEEGRMTSSSSQMTYSEIGSNFWLDDSSFTENQGEGGAWLPSTEDSAFAFSGRTAMDLIVRDIQKDRRLKKIRVPAYCCVSMLQAFIDHGIRYEFYPVTYENGQFQYDIQPDDDSDALLIMSYFGLSRAAVDAAVDKAKREGKIVIEDITHSLLSDGNCSPKSDYYVASLRKWFPIPSGGWYGKRVGGLQIKPELDSDETVSATISAMREKAEYIRGNITEKRHYLEALSKCENEIIHVDRMLKMDTFSLNRLRKTNVREVAKRRRANAAVLLRRLQAVPQVKCAALDLNTETPLFMPVFVDDRDGLRSFLIEHGVYCPVHWPENMGADSVISDHELSLICDQRYAENDMNTIVDLILEWSRKARRE